MGEIIFKDLVVQKGERVKIPKPIVDTLNLRAGKKIIIKFDVEKRRILIEEDLKKNRRKK